jgi:hypothetical protein
MVLALSAGAVFAADFQTDTASIEFQDMSTTSHVGEPTAQEILALVLRRLDQVTGKMRERMERCLTGDYQHEPAVAVTCTQFIPVSRALRSFRVRLKSFSKLGCMPGASNRQFECQFETSLDGNSRLVTGELERVYVTPAIQKALFIRNTDDTWTMKN